MKLTELSNYALKILRRIYLKIWGKQIKVQFCECNPDIASELIYEALISEGPCMIARFGGFELSTTVNYLGVKNDNKNIIRFIKGLEPDWYWNKSLINFMYTNAGFFPPTVAKIEQFSELMIQDISNVDILGSWLHNEFFVESMLKSKNIHLRFLEPFWTHNPWTKALKNKKVLVVHPFVKTIEAQYKNRNLLFEKEILPEFKLYTIPAVQSIGNTDNRFSDWFEALDFMKNEIDKVDYDICLIGAGAYGFPLASHVKRSGKKAVHLGGSLQLLFGIKGSRWEDPNYGVEEWGITAGSYLKLMNDYWVRPSENEKPNNAGQVEGACYW